MSPTLTQAEYVRLKRRLSTVTNKLKRCTGYPGAPNYCVPINDEDDPRIPIQKAIIAEVRYAFGIFNREGYPDSWHTWRVAADDASWALGRFYPGYDEAVDAS